MTIPTITVLPVAPARTDTPAVFNTRADAFLGALYSPFSTQMNASITAINTDISGIAANVTAAQLAETNAETAETNAETAETNAEAQVVLASNQVTLAADQVTLAAGQVTLATTQAGNSATSATAAATTYDQFDDRYLGAFATDPTVNNDGDALVAGTQYFNTTNDVTRVYNGTAFQDSASVATSIALGSQVTGILPFVNGGTGVATGTGTGSAVLNVSPAITTPAITTGLDDSAGNLVIPFDANQYFSGTFSDKVTVAGNTGTALTINANLANVVTATLNGNATLTLATPNAVANRSTSFTLILTNDGTPSRTVALAGGTFYYPGGSISRTTTANAIDIWFFFSPDGGTSWYVTLPMKNLTT